MLSNDHADRNRHQTGGHGRAMRMTGRPTVTPLPPLREGQVRCPCGKGVRLSPSGRLRGHQTLISKVTCIYGGTVPDGDPI